MRKLAVLAAMIGALFLVPSAQAATPATVLDGALTCGEVTDEGSGADAVSTSLGQVWCGSIRASDNINATLDETLPTNRSTVKTFDDTPLDVNFALPDAGEFGPPPYPVVGTFHGYGGSKFNFRNFQRWLDRGYAAYSITQRGFGESCRSAASQNADPAGCADGYVRLMDSRYEVRDTQEFLGILADEDLIIPDKIATTGGSYGGGMSMSLAALKDRKMLLNGSLVSWESPDGKEMEIAVATPNIPWTELTYALVPNGNNIDYIRDASYFGRTGVMKESYIQGLSVSGRNAPIGSNPAADIEGWKARLDAGENYDGDPAVEAMISEINTYHSSYGIDHGQAPAPLLISSGYTDDLFPVNEATRFYNRTRAQYPDLPLALFFGSFGHDRGQTQSNVSSARSALENQWIEHYLGGVGPQPASDVTSYSQTCPSGSAGGGPYAGSDWATIAPGEIRVVDDGADQTVSATGGDTAVGLAWNPLTGPNPCTTQPGGAEPGSANYETAAAPAGGFTVLGATTVIAKIEQAGTNSQIAARLVDLSPDGTEKTLVSRGLWRPQGTGFQVFQLFANNWTVEAGHKLRLELLPRDSGQTNPGGFLTNYGRPSNGQQDAIISKLEFRVPVVEAPGSLGGLVTAPAKKVLPDRPNVELAPGYSAIGSETLLQYGIERDPCPEGYTGTTPPDCTPVPCPVGTSGPGGGDCTPNATVGRIRVLGATVKGRFLTARINCAARNTRCNRANVVFRGAPKRGRGRGVVLARRSGVGVAAGRTARVRFNLTARGRALFRNTRQRVRARGKVRVRTVRGLRQLRTQVRIGGRAAGVVNVRRAGRVR